MSSVSVTTNGEVAPVPHKMQAAVLLKLMAFHKGINATDSIVVYVAGSEEFAAELRSGIGMPVGASVLKDVRIGTAAPSSKPDVLYIGQPKTADKLIAYARENDVLSLAGDPSLVEKGVTLGVGTENNRLKVLYNAQAAAEEGAEWEAGLFKLLDSQK
jgi:type III secretion system FlhB-like substrate exporter